MNNPFQDFATTFPNFPGAMCSSEYVNPEWWFPESLRDPNDRQSTINHAVALCGYCPFKQQCLDFALEHEIWDGIWGGVLSHQRRMLKPDVVKQSVRQRKLNNVRKLLNMGFALEKACREIGISTKTYDRYLCYEKAGWSTAHKTTSKSKGNK